MQSPHKPQPGKGTRWTCWKLHVAFELKEELAALFDVEVGAGVRTANEHDGQLALMHELLIMMIVNLCSHARTHNTTPCLLLCLHHATPSTPPSSQPCLPQPRADTIHHKKRTSLRSREIPEA